ncbi:hypothetical protein EIP91_007021 [Steccherinum ochraceum]|uniref:F-box domain-containing protein n=1 Tax=Steccherinum ochraceum TaxID=92696 RepID=A0A4R0RUY3_9APHY|nr:hypothetical protein EIP91_007021 [Steccherinum ochraceum]
MDVLWSSLPSLTAFFKCLPADTWYEEDHEKITAAIGWDDEYSQYSKSHTRRVLGWYQDPTGSPFPNLTDLSVTWDDEDALSLTYLPCLVTNKLCSLQLSASETATNGFTDNSIRLALRSLFNRCSGLQCLQVVVSEPVALVIADEVIPRLVEFPRLHTLEFDADQEWNLESLYQVGRHPALKHVKLNLTGTDWRKHARSLVAKSLFPALQTMKLTLTHGADSFHLIRMLASTTLSRIEVYHRTYVMAAVDLQSILEEIASHRHSLTNVKLMVYDYDQAEAMGDGFRSPQPPYIVQEYHLQPLLSLNHLRDLTISLETLIDIDDGWTEATKSHFGRNVTIR